MLLDVSCFQLLKNNDRAYDEKVKQKRTGPSTTVGRSKRDISGEKKTERETEQRTQEKEGEEVQEQVWCGGT